MPQHYSDRTNQLTAPFQQEQPGVQQPAPGQQQGGQDEELQAYLTEQVGSIRRSMNTVKSKSFPFATRLNALNSFLSNFGKILGESADPINLDTFKSNEQEITDTANKMFQQVEMLNKGELSMEDFFKVAAETFNETEGGSSEFDVGIQPQVSQAVPTPEKVTPDILTLPEQFFTR